MSSDERTRALAAEAEAAAEAESEVTCLPGEEGRFTRFFTRKRRLWVYGIVVAGAPLLVALGALSDGIAGNILVLAAAVLGVGGSSLALKNIEK